MTKNKVHGKFRLVDNISFMRHAVSYFILPSRLNILLYIEESTGGSNNRGLKYRGPWRPNYPSNLNKWQEWSRINVLNLNVNLEIL